MIIDESAYLFLYHNRHIRKRTKIIRRVQHTHTHAHTTMGTDGVLKEKLYSILANALGAALTIVVCRRRWWLWNDIGREMIVGCCSLIGKSIACTRRWIRTVVVLIRWKSTLRLIVIPIRIRILTGTRIGTRCIAWIARLAASLTVAIALWRWSHLPSRIATRGRRRSVRTVRSGID